MATEREMTGAEHVRRLYEDSENRTAKAFEELVARDSFGELLARMTENVVALTRIGTDVFDLVLRNLRLAGRQDVTRLARQLARAEDKLELVLQEVERVHDRLDEPGRSSRIDGNSRGAEAPASGAGDEGS
jgi:ketosteroid isomerase-like protein